jgi:SNF2 family DNA or RNA helicase
MIDNLPKPFRYQVYARQKIRERKRTAVIAPPGSGKTRPIIEGVDDLEGFDKPVLILCTGPAIATWKRQIPLWKRDEYIKDNIHVVRGDVNDRQDMWERAAVEQFGVFITNFAIFRLDYELIRQVPWNVVIADEYHKCMRSHKVRVKKKLKTYGMFKMMTRHTPIVVLATGSIIRRNAASMFTAFQAVNPFLFSSYWRFVNTYCHVDDTEFGQQVYGIRNAKALRQLMDDYLVYIPPELAAESLPKGRRYPIDVDLTDEQRKVYRELDKEMMAVVGDNIVVASTVMGKLTKLRQLLCCPKILDPSLGMGAGYEAILDRLDTDPHVAIFVPFRPACDFVQIDLIQRGFKNVFVLRGGTDHDVQQQLVEKYRDTRGIMICTIAYAESFDLETCKTSYFLGYDLVADQNEQAEGRTRRAISEHAFVTWGYIKTNTSVDWHFLNKLGEDTRTAKLVLQRPESYIQMLREAQ